MTEMLTGLLFPAVMLLMVFFIYDPIMAGIIKLIVFIREATAR